MERCVGTISALNGVQERAAEFENKIHEAGWETLAQRRLTARICALFKAHAEGTGLENDRG
jgi:hypothetical protein